jgi:hypothetical protein
MQGLEESVERVGVVEGEMKILERLATFVGNIDKRILRMRNLTLITKTHTFCLESLIDHCFVTYLVPSSIQFFSLLNDSIRLVMRRAGEGSSREILFGCEFDFGETSSASSFEEHYSPFGDVYSPCSTSSASLTSVTPSPSSSPSSIPTLQWDSLPPFFLGLHRNSSIRLSPVCCTSEGVCV